MLDIIGLLYTSPVLDDQGEVITPGETLPGWHVNSIYPVEGWQQYKVTPNTPRRVFSGVDTFFYTFPDEATFDALAFDTITDEENNTIKIPKELTREVELVATKAVPVSVSARQICQAMNRIPYGETTLRIAVETAVSAGDQDLKDWWNKSIIFERYNPQVSVMAQALQVAEETVDELWLLADTL